MLFEWDDTKAAINRSRHQLAFSEAAEVFLDPGLYIADTSRPEDGENRLKNVGLVNGRLLTVVLPGAAMCAG